MMNDIICNMTIQKFIKARPYLIWYVRDFEALSEEAVVEAVLNYGDFDDVKKIITILGIRKIAQIFKKHAWRKRSNYRPEIKNYFKLYFRKYAPSA